MARVTLLLIAFLALAAAPAQAQLPTVPTGLTTVPGCDPIDPSACLHPWPNDYFTKADPTTATGRRLNLLPTSTPRNVGGKPIDVTDLNRHDGFSPGSAILTKVPGLTVETFNSSGFVREGDMYQYNRQKTPAVVIDTVTSKRHLIWAEMDLNAQNPEDRVLIMRPGKNFVEGRRYVVALRFIKNADGTFKQPNDAFKAYRDKIPTGNPVMEARRPAMEQIFTDLEKALIPRNNLFLAWDFTVASERDRSERVLHMRDTAFAELGDSNLADLKVEGAAPTFTVDSVTDQDDGRRKVTGKFTVPCFLDKPGCVPGSRMLFSSPSATLPTRIPGNTQEATYTCFLPRAAVAGGNPVGTTRPSLYGHGLLGGQGEVGSGPQRDMVTRFNMMYCATDWYGFATEDLGSVGLTLLDASNFPLLADRMQQGILAFHYLGRLAIHPQGFASHTAFKRPDGKPTLDLTRLYYDGNSQGGIMGGAVVATSPDVERGVLGVPGMNYSTLLQRSVDFESDPDTPCPPNDVNKLREGIEGAEYDDPESFLGIIGFSYACPLYLSYPNVVERQLLLGLMQQLWDRGEANGYAHHMTSDPLENTPPHEVLLHVALGDHQVAQVSAEVEARTIGARVRAVAVDPGRSYDVTPQYGILKNFGFPAKGSALEIWDSGPIREGGLGNDVAPHGTIPNRPGRDPHGDPRSTKAAQFQKDAFFRPGGLVTDQCAQFHGGARAQPCYSRNWKGSTGW